MNYPQCSSNTWRKCYVYIYKEKHTTHYSILFYLSFVTIKSYTTVLPSWNTIESKRQTSMLHHVNSNCSYNDEFKEIKFCCAKNVLYDVEWKVLAKRNVFNVFMRVCFFNTLYFISQYESILVIFSCWIVLSPSFPGVLLQYTANRRIVNIKHVVIKISY